MGFLEKLREKNNFTKKMASGTWNMRSYNKYNEDIREAPINFLLDMAEQYGVNYQEILNGYNITPDNANSYEKLRMKLSHAFNTLDEAYLKSFIEKYDKHKFDSTKQLNMWITAKLYPIYLSDADKNLKISTWDILNDYDLEQILIYFESIHSKNSFFHTFNDYQVLMNLMAYFSLENKTFQLLFNLMTNDLDGIQTNIRSYNLFSVGVSNYMIRAIKETNYQDAIDLYSFFTELNPVFPLHYKDTSSRILIEVLYCYALFYLKGDQKHITKAIDMYTMALDINDTIILSGSEDILSNILQSNVIKKDISALIRGSDTDILVHSEGDLT